MKCAVDFHQAIIWTKFEIMLCAQVKAINEDVKKNADVRASGCGKIRTPSAARARPICKWRVSSSSLKFIEDGQNHCDRCDCDRCDNDNSNIHKHYLKYLARAA
jgi:hypothetical protein